MGYLMTIPVLVAYLCFVAPIISQTTFEVSFYKSLGQEFGFKDEATHFSWSNSFLEPGGLNLQLSKKTTRILIPNNQKKGYWLRIDIKNRSDSEIIAFINKATNEADLKIKDNSMKFKAEYADMEGFKNEENVMKVHKNFDGEGWLTIINNQQLDEIDDENELYLTKTIHDSGLQVSIVGVLPDETLPCVESCKNNSTCNKVTKKCDCSEKVFASSTIHQFYGRDCNKRVIVVTESTFKEDIYVDQQQTATIAFFNPNLIYLSNMSLVPSVWARYMTFGQEISEDNIYDPNRNQRKNLNLANNDDKFKILRADNFNKKYDSNFHKTNIKRTGQWTFVNVYNLNPNQIQSLSVDYEIIDYNNSHPWLYFFYELVQISCVIILLCCFLVTIIQCGYEYCSNRQNSRVIIGDIIRDNQDQFKQIGNDQWLTQDLIELYFEKFFWTSDQNNPFSTHKEICTICLDAFENDTKLICRRIPFCKHILHDKCFLRLVRYKKNCCPNCQVPFTKEQLNKYILHLEAEQNEAQNKFSKISDEEENNSCDKTPIAKIKKKIQKIDKERKSSIVITFKNKQKLKKEQNKEKLRKDKNKEEIYSKTVLRKSPILTYRRNHIPANHRKGQNFSLDKDFQNKIYSNISGDYTKKDMIKKFQQATDYTQKFIDWVNECDNIDISKSDLFMRRISDIRVSKLRGDCFDEKMNEAKVQKLSEGVESCNGQKKKISISSSITYIDVYHTYDVESKSITCDFN